MNEFKNMPYTFYLDNYKKRQWLVRVWKKGKSVWQWEERITRTELKKKSSSRRGKGEISNSN